MTETRPGARRPLPDDHRVVYITSITEEGTNVSRLMKPVSLVAAVAVLCGVAACASAPKTDAQRQTDKETTERVETALSADKSLYSTHIVVRADNGVVRLTGFVWEPADFQLAAAIAGSVPGVTAVVNDLELNRNGNDSNPVAR